MSLKFWVLIEAVRVTLLFIEAFEHSTTRQELSVETEEDAKTWQMISRLISQNHIHLSPKNLLQYQGWI